MRAIAVPVKALSRAKSRLAPVLSPLERAALSLAMLEDVLDAALAATGWETWVGSPDEAVLEGAVRRRALPVAVVQAAGLAFDLHVPGDLPRVLSTGRAGRASRTLDCLVALDVEARLAALPRA